MSDDPWGSDPTEDIPPWEIDSNQDSQVAKRRAQSEPTPEPATTARKETQVKVTTESTEDEGRYDGISVTFKGNGGFDQPWIVVHAATVGAALKEVSDRKFGELIQKAQQVGAYWSGLAGPGGRTGGNSGGSSSNASSGDGGGGGPKGAPAKAEDPEPGEHFCKHGEMRFNSGVNDAGKAWSGWFCSEPKDSTDKCKPQWPQKKR